MSALFIVCWIWGFPIRMFQWNSTQDKPRCNETVLILVEHLQYPIPAVWNGKKWVSRYSHLKIVGDDRANIDNDFMQRHVIKWCCIN